MEKINSLRFILFKHSKDSFLLALDEAGINHGPDHPFSTEPQAAGIIEAISALADSMPWNAIAKVIVAWMESRKSRKVIVAIEGDKIVHIEGYSVAEVQKILQNAREVTVIDTQPDRESHKKGLENKI